MVIGCTIFGFNVAKQTAQANAWDGADNMFIAHVGSENWSFGADLITDASTKSTIQTDSSKTYLGVLAKVPKSGSTQEGNAWVPATNAAQESSATVSTAGGKTTMTVEFLRDFISTATNGDGPYSLTKEIPFSVISNPQMCRSSRIDENDDLIFYTDAA